LNKIGIIADDSPEEFLSEEKDAVDLYKTVFIQAKAIQELKSEVDELKEQLNNLRDLIMLNVNKL
jgi:polyhydroxyalkanoate synthesis regulator phasin